MRVHQIMALFELETEEPILRPQFVAYAWEVPHPPTRLGPALPATIQLAIIMHCTTPGLRFRQAGERHKSPHGGHGSGGEDTGTHPTQASERP
jgi:hypothetical protein